MCKDKDQHLCKERAYANITKTSMHRAGQRCFELLALIGSPQLSFSKVFPPEVEDDMASSGS